MGVFACGWLGFVFAFLVFAFLVFAFLVLACLVGVVG